MNNLIGRKQEQQELKDLYESGRAEFVAVYGRRRVGKTKLIEVEKCTNMVDFSIIIVLFHKKVISLQPKAKR